MGGSSSLAMPEPAPAAAGMLCAVGARSCCQPAAGWGARRLTRLLNVSETNVSIRVHELIFRIDFSRGLNAFSVTFWQRFQ